MQSVRFSGNMRTLQFCVILFCVLELNDGAWLVYWPSMFGVRPQKWGVYPDACNEPCDNIMHTSVLYIAKHGENCINYAQWETNDFAYFNLMDLTNWRSICAQKVGLY